MKDQTLTNGSNKSTLTERIMNNNSFNKNGFYEKNNGDSRKVNLRTWGFKQAGQNKGSLKSLLNAMYQIYNGYLNEIAGKQNRQTDEINKQIETVKTDITDVNNHINHISKHEIPEQQSQIENFKNEQEDIRIKSEEGFIDSDFNWVKTILFTLFSVMLGLSLIFFYTSLIYNGLFKDVGESLQSATIDDSSSLFNTLLDVKSLFTLNTGIVLSYLFSSLFLTMGLLLHAKRIAQTRLQSIGQWVAKGFLLFIAFGAEVVFAYKIEKNIDEIKSLTLPDYIPAQHWTDLLFSVDVLIVITLGFIAYLIWSFALEGAFIEWNKRNPKRLAMIKVRELDRKINRRKYKIGEFNKQLSILEGKLNTLQNKLNVLKNKLNLVFFQPVELDERLEAFFNGWLRYINNHEDFKQTINQQQELFLSTKTNLLNNQIEGLTPNEN
jgi:hypothetical protein